MISSFAAKFTRTNTKPNFGKVKGKGNCVPESTRPTPPQYNKAPESKFMPTMTSKPISEKGALEIIANGKYSRSELNAASYMTELGYDVTLRPPAGTRLSGGTSDLIVNGMNYDVYTPITNNPSRIISEIAAKKDQAVGIVLDLSQTTVTEKQLGDIIARLKGKGVTNINHVVIIK